MLDESCVAGLLQRLPWMSLCGKHSVLHGCDLISSNYVHNVHKM